MDARLWTGLCFAKSPPPTPSPPPLLEGPKEVTSEITMAPSPVAFLLGSAVAVSTYVYLRRNSPTVWRYAPSVEDIVVSGLCGGVLGLLVDDFILTSSQR